MYQDDTKEGRESKELFLGLGATSRLIMPGRTITHLHRNPGQRGVLGIGNTVLQITLNPRTPSSSLRDATHGKRVVFSLRSSQRGQLLLTKLATFTVGI